MKPSDFIMNSDYLSIAQIASNTYSVNIPAGSIVADGYMEQNFDFTTREQVGTIDNVLIKKDNDTFIHGDYMWVQPTTTSSGIVAGFVRVFRPSSTQIRIQIVLENYSYVYPGVTLTYPAMQFMVRVSSFKVPNIL